MNKKKCKKLPLNNKSVKRPFLQTTLQCFT